jgi:predicted membrane-bound spermidine synthase
MPAAGPAVAAPRRQWPMLALAFVEGGAVMAAELVGARMLAPIYGNSLYVWGSVIGVTLVSLTAGYYAGGLLSYRASRQAIVYWLMLIAGLLISLMPVVAEQLLARVEAVGAIRSIVLLASLFLLPPLALLGATTPLIIATLAGGTADAGRVSGLVYGVSTIGGIIVTFATGFYLIPEFGLSRTALATGIVLALMPFALLLAGRHYLALAHPALLAVLLIASAQGARHHPGVELLYRSEGLLGQVQVVDMHLTNMVDRSQHTDRVLFINRTGQTWVDRATGESRWDYPKFVNAVATLFPEGSRALLLGLGGGTVARSLQSLGYTVDAVELDERMPMVAKQYFGLTLNGDLFVDDGRHFLRTTGRRYQVVVFDVFQAEIPPANLLTLETFRGLKDRLEPGGLLIINYTGFLSGSAGYGARSIYKTLLAAGYRVKLLPTAAAEDNRNNLYIASPAEVDFSHPRAPVMIDGQARDLAGFFTDPATIDLEQALVLTDDQPILEKLNLEAAAIWRASYFKYFTKPFLDMGIPLFD